MNQGAKAHSMYTVAFRYLEKNKQKERNHIHNLKTCPEYILVPNKIYATM